MHCDLRMICCLFPTCVSEGKSTTLPVIEWPSHIRGVAGTYTTLLPSDNLFYPNTMPHVHHSPPPLLPRLSHDLTNLTQTCPWSTHRLQIAGARPFHSALSCVSPTDSKEPGARRRNKNVPTTRLQRAYLHNRGDPRLPGKERSKPEGSREGETASEDHALHM